jgi:hypothetical protein
VVTRSTAAFVFADLLGRALFRELRQEGGLSYQAAADYEPRDGEHAVITAIADALPAKREAVLGGFVDVLAALRIGTINQSELDSVRGRALENLNHPDADAARLPGHARNLLHGHANLTTDEARAELEALTVADMRRVAQEAYATALVMTPSGTTADWAGLAAAPTSSAERVAGKRWPSLVHAEHALVIGDEGVSLTGPNGQATVRYQDCAAALTRPDGARYLTGADGVAVNIEPTLFTLPAGEIARIDAALPREVLVPLPARGEDQIPQPPAKGQRPRSRSGIWYGPLADRLVYSRDMLLCIAVLCAFLALGAANSGDSGAAVGLGIGVLIAAVPPTMVRTVRQFHARR